MKWRAPAPSADTRAFWQGISEDRIVLQRCSACSHVFLHPRPFCPRCHARDVEDFDSTGRAILISSIVNHRPPEGFPHLVAPYAIGLVELAEGPRLAAPLIPGDTPFSSGCLLQSCFLGELDGKIPAFELLKGRKQR